MKFNINIYFFQRVLVALGRTDEALVVAERGRTRAFVDFLLERQQLETDSWYSGLDSTPVTREQILDIVSKQKAAVLYYSIAAGFLYSWLILPEKGNATILHYKTEWKLYGNWLLCNQLNLRPVSVGNTTP